MPSCNTYHLTWVSPTFDVGYLFTASDLASITSHIHTWVLFLLWLHPFILSGVISPLISSSILGTSDLGSSSFSILSFCLFILFMGFSRQEYWFAIESKGTGDQIGNNNAAEQSSLKGMGNSLRGFLFEKALMTKKRNQDN